MWCQQCRDSIRRQFLGSREMQSPQLGQSSLNLLQVIQFNRQLTKAELTDTCTHHTELVLPRRDKRLLAGSWGVFSKRKKMPCKQGCCYQEDGALTFKVYTQACQENPQAVLPQGLHTILVLHHESAGH